MPDPELDMFISTSKYTWQEVANSDELGQFLSEAGISSTTQRSKLERLLHRDGFDTIGDFHDMTSANTQMYLNKGIPHLNVLKLVEYIHEVWEAHGQEKVADLEPPPTPKAGDASSGDRFSNEVEDAHTNERGSTMTHNEREEAARPTPMRCNSSALRREIAKAELKKELASEMMGELTDTLWDMGIRKSRQLTHLDWEDVSNKGITRVQFKVLQHIGREHSAPNVPPSTGDVEMQEMALPLAPLLPPINEQLLGGEAAETLPVADGALTKSGEGQSAQL